MHEKNSFYVLSLRVLSCFVLPLSLKSSFLRRKRTALKTYFLIWNFGICRNQVLNSKWLFYPTFIQSLLNQTPSSNGYKYVVWRGSGVSGFSRFPNFFPWKILKENFPLELLSFFSEKTFFHHKKNPKKIFFGWNFSKTKQSIWRFDHNQSCNDQKNLLIFEKYWEKITQKICPDSWACKFRISP